MHIRGQKVSRNRRRKWKEEEGEGGLVDLSKSAATILWSQEGWKRKRSTVTRRRGEGALMAKETLTNLGKFAAAAAAAAAATVRVGGGGRTRGLNGVLLLRRRNSENGERGRERK